MEMAVVDATSRAPPVFLKWTARISLFVTESDNAASVWAILLVIEEDDASAATSPDSNMEVADNRQAVVAGVGCKSDEP